MTIIEVLFAIVILSGVMLSLARFGQSFTRASREAAMLTAASDLAVARLEHVRAHADYASLVTTFDGTVESSAGGGGTPPMTVDETFTRRTDAMRIVTDTTDFVTVTVTIGGGSLRAPVAKTAVVAAFP